MVCGRPNFVPPNTLASVDPRVSRGSAQTSVARMESSSVPSGSGGGGGTGVSAPITAAFDAETMAEMSEVFAFFDRDRDGVLQAEELGAVLRSLGYSPSEASLADLERQVHRMYGGKLAWREFVSFVATQVLPLDREHSEDPERIQEAFELFGDLYRGGDTGRIALKDLEALLTQRGEPLDARSFSYMLRVAPPDASGTVSYDALVDAVARGARKSSAAPAKK
jgi:Ca2+-binding EF-hand superfamily protein